MAARYALAALLVVACEFAHGRLRLDAGSEPADAADAAVDAPIDAGPCGSCDDSDPCTIGRCEGARCVSTPRAMPASCAGGALFSCAGQPTCYARCPGAIAWAGAESQCTGWGGHLVTVLDAGEAGCIGTATGGVRAWIGYFQEPGAGPEPAGAWEWASGAAVGAVRWLPPQPNNNVDVLTEGQDCAFTEQVTGAWFDHECTAVEHGFVCEQ